MDEFFVEDLREIVGFIFFPVVILLELVDDHVFDPYFGEHVSQELDVFPCDDHQGDLGDLLFIVEECVEFRSVQDIAHIGLFFWAVDRVVGEFELTCQMQAASFLHLP